MCFADEREHEHTLILFHMTSVSGVMDVQEVLNPARTHDLHTSFPVLQSDLYNASQPGNLFYCTYCVS